MEKFLPDLAPTATGAFLSSRKRTVTFVSLATGYPSPASVSPCSEALCFSMAEAFLPKTWPAQAGLFLWPRLLRVVLEMPRGLTSPSAHFPWQSVRDPHANALPDTRTGRRRPVAAAL